MQINETETALTLPMAGLRVAQGHTTLKTFVGSCVAICIYDKIRQIGGMAHVMLPKNNTDKTTIGTKQEGKFADEAVETIINQMKKYSSELKLEAKIAGGAKIFSHESENGILDIGNRNIVALKEILNNKQIPLVSQSVGKTHGRWVTFSCSTQKTVVKEKGVEKII